MSALVIKSFPEELHARLKQVAASHRRSVTQETIHLLEKALAVEAAESSAPVSGSYWATRQTLPEYDAALKAGEFSQGADSTTILSEERDAR